MLYQSKVKTSKPETLAGLQSGQWIEYLGNTGRYMGTRNGVIWIAWTRYARGKGFHQFARAYKRNRH
jgi:hypothetical protein